MSEPTGGEPRKVSHYHRLALVATALLIVIVVLLLPFAIQSVLVELVGEPSNTLYGLDDDRAIRLTPRRTAPAAETYFNVLVDNIDESTRVATLRLTGHRTCTAPCPAYTVVFASVSDDADQRTAMPPSASIAIKPDTVLVNETVQLPVQGQPSLYPFDTYRLWLGVIAYANLPDGTIVPLHRGDLSRQTSVTLQARLARLIMQDPVPIDPSRVHADTDPFSFFSVSALTFVRPYYLKALTILLILLITASGFFAICMRPVHDLFLGIGGVILGVWGVRSILVQTSLPYVTAVDLALSAVILFLLFALAVRVGRHFHRLSDVHLPWTRRES